MLFWETGAVGSMPGPGGGALSFRVGPSGWVLGRAAVSFIAERLAPLMRRDAGSLRFGVAYVDDLYGRAVADGAVQRIRDLGLSFAGRFPYPAQRPELGRVATEVAHAGTDVLFVSAYLEDGIALRRELVRQHVPLVAGIGTSSSFCHLAFGEALGQDAVGLFASDKPDGDAIDADGLLPGARALLERARAAYRAAYNREMSAPALSGFSATWALLREIMPGTRNMTPHSVGEAAVRKRIPLGGLPDGSGLELVGATGGDPGANLRASSVIWEWIGVNRRAVVWPPRFATAPITPLPLTW
jgi:ABC-type branched-subunit amino acid transport system substrate-binding protein